ncbi:MAG: methylmalonyl-CoA epimerase [Gemmatimonadota bacterium]|jgi:methylmalonyl-CoA/ethylmalonyl-CoA epimerase|nr:methylmalonyl-CoA epimerase [Gemmatimonadota bacterium]
MNQRTLDHLGVAVTSLDNAIPIWEKLTGTTAINRETVEEMGVEVVFLGSGAGSIELLAPVRPDSTLARFLERRGPGLHHLCFRVNNLRTALAEFQEEGFILIDQTPRVGAHRRRIAFLHPKATGGALIELLEAP